MSVTNGMKDVENENTAERTLHVALMRIRALMMNEGKDDRDKVAEAEVIARVAIDLFNRQKGEEERYA